MWGIALVWMNLLGFTAVAPETFLLLTFCPKHAGRNVRSRNVSGTMVIQPRWFISNYDIQSWKYSLLFLSVLDLFFITKRNLFSDERICCVFLLRLLKLWENATNLGNKRYIYWLRWKSSNIEYYIHAVSKFMTHISRSFTGDYVLQRNPLFGSIMQWHYKHLIHLWYWETNVFYCKLFAFHILRGSSMAQKNQVSLVNLASKMRRLITKSTWPVEEMCCTIPKVNNHSQLLHGLTGGSRPPLVLAVCFVLNIS